MAVKNNYVVIRMEREDVEKAGGCGFDERASGREMRGGEVPVEATRMQKPQIRENCGKALDARCEVIGEKSKAPPSKTEDGAP